MGALSWYPHVGMNISWYGRSKINSTLSCRSALSPAVKVRFAVCRSETRLVHVIRCLFSSFDSICDIWFYAGDFFVLMYRNNLILNEILLVFVIQNLNLCDDGECRHFFSHCFTGIVTHPLAFRSPYVL